MKDLLHIIGMVLWFLLIANIMALCVLLLVVWPILLNIHFGAVCCIWITEIVLIHFVGKEVHK